MDNSTRIREAVKRSREEDIIKRQIVREEIVKHDNKLVEYKLDKHSSEKRVVRIREESETLSPDMGRNRRRANLSVENVYDTLNPLRVTYEEVFPSGAGRMSDPAMPNPRTTFAPPVPKRTFKTKADYQIIERSKFHVAAEKYSPDEFDQVLFPSGKEVLPQTHEAVLPQSLARDYNNRVETVNDTREQYLKSNLSIPNSIAIGV